jgi:ABC-type amino acid transport system permease subunit
MVVNLLIGLPGDRPGGLFLTLITFFASGAAALIAGFVYAAVCVALPRASLVIQGGSAVLRGIPLILLMFLLANVSLFTIGAAGLAALTLYSFGHVGEILRSFLAAYPKAVADQARLTGISFIRESLQLRAPWTLWRSWTALMTHWISLLKDTGALVVLGIGELTTTAKVLSESSPSLKHWATVLTVAAALYLGATLALVRFMPWAAGKVLRILQQRDSAMPQAGESYATHGVRVEGSK